MLKIPTDILAMIIAEVLLLCESYSDCVKCMGAFRSISSEWKSIVDNHHLIRQHITKVYKLRGKNLIYNFIRGNIFTVETCKELITAHWNDYSIVKYPFLDKYCLMRENTIVISAALISAVGDHLIVSDDMNTDIHHKLFGNVIFTLNGIVYVSEIESGMLLLWRNNIAIFHGNIKNIIQIRVGKYILWNRYIIKVSTTCGLCEMYYYHRNTISTLDLPECLENCKRIYSSQRVTVILDHDSRIHGIDTETLTVLWTLKGNGFFVFDKFISIDKCIYDLLTGACVKRYRHTITNMGYNQCCTKIVLSFT